MTSTRFAIAGLLVLGALASLAWLYGRGAADRSTPASATVLPAPRPLPDFALVDAAGQPLTRASLAGRWHLLFFGFANCPDVCPLTLARLAAARRQLAERGQAPLPEILFISVDPARDTPAILADYAASFDAGITAATGDLAELRQLADGVGVYFSAGPGDDDGGDYPVNHSAAVLLVNPAAELAAVFTSPQSADEFVTDLPRLLEPQ